MLAFVVIPTESQGFCSPPFSMCEKVEISMFEKHRKQRRTKNGRKRKENRLFLVLYIPYIECIFLYGYVIYYGVYWGSLFLSVGIVDFFVPAVKFPVETVYFLVLSVPVLFYTVFLEKRGLLHPLSRVIPIPFSMPF